MRTTLRATLGLPVVILLSSCADPGMYYPAGGFPVGGAAPVVVDEVVGVPAMGGGWGPGWGGWGGGWNRGWGGGWNRGWGGGGWGPGWAGGPFVGGAAWRCNRCNRNPCCCSQHQHGGTRAPASNNNDRKYRIIAGDLGGKKRPNDFHSLDWFHRRGYSLQNVKFETDRGTVIDRRPSSQRSSSSSSSRGSSSTASNSRSKSSSSSSTKGRPSSSASSSRPVTFGDHLRGEFAKKK